MIGRTVGMIAPFAITELPGGEHVLWINGHELQRGDARTIRSSYRDCIGHSHWLAFIYE